MTQRRKGVKAKNLSNSLFLADLADYRRYKLSLICANLRNLRERLYQ